MMMKMIWRNLGTLAAVRFADVKEVDPAVECKAHLSIKLVMMTMIITMMIDMMMTTIRAAAVARLPRSLLDPELFPHTAYVKILATLARKTVN